MTAKARVLLMMSTEEGYARQLFKGVIAYARPATSWELHRIRQWPQALPVIRKWRPHGIIGHFDNERVYHTVCALGIPLVEVLRHPTDEKVPHVVVDDVAVGRVAAVHFLQRGFRHFGFVGYNSLEFSYHRRIGFERALHERGHSCVVYLHRCPERELDLDGSWLSQEARLANWMRHLPRPAALFVADDNAAFEVSESCLKQGIAVPEDVAILGVDNDDLLCQMSQPPLSSVRMPLERVGFEAARLLDQLMQGHRPPPKSVVLQPLDVAKRQSTDIVALSDPTIAEALRFISRHATEPILVQDVLAAVAVSRSLLEKRFRVCLGRTPLAEIIRQRIERARHLLAETDLDISKIAPLCGFRTTSRLSAIFHQQTGQTPSAYRKSLKA
jgi:LacI family transcriptional regulator